MQGGDREVSPGSKFFHFMQFSPKNLKNNRMLAVGGHKILDRPLKVRGHLIGHVPGGVTPL